MEQKRKPGRPREKERVTVSGILTAYGADDRYTEGRTKYSVQLEMSKEELDELREKARPWYNGSDPKYIPKWLDGKEGDKVVFRSNYDIPYGINIDGVDMIIEGHTFSYMSKLIEKSKTKSLMSNIPDELGDIKGSRVKAHLILKQGACYISEMQVTDLKKRGLCDYFEGV